MKYPSRLEGKLAKISEIVSSWPVEKTVDEVMAWILQFESEYHDLALRIVKNLNIIGPDDLNSALSIAYSKLLRHAREKDLKVNKENTLYMPIGNDGKSGAMIAYNFRMINGLNSSYFLSKDTLSRVKDGSVENLVLIDDIIATGAQSSKQLVEVAEKARSLGIQNIYLMTAFGYKAGIERLRTTAVADVFSAVEYDENDTVMSLDSAFYEGLPHMKRVQYWEAIKKYYRGYGYGDIGALIVFYYNTPNCTLNMIWGSTEGWKPLFPRKFDLHNIGPELYELDELIKKENTADVVPKYDCSIYVEGKVEELFIQELAKKYENFGYDSVNVVSIGSFTSSSLISSLQRFSKKVFFVTSNDQKVNNGYTKSVREAMGDTPVTQMEPVMNYFLLEKIKESERFKNVVAKELMDNDVNEITILDTLETRLIRKAPNFYKVDNMKELIEKCAFEDKLNNLLSLFQKEESEV